MSKRIFQLAGILMVLFGLFAVNTVFARETPPPLEDPSDNLCYAGGAWDDGRCNIPQIPGATELAWKCGWFMARILDGRLAADQIPTECMESQHAEAIPECVVYMPSDIELTTGIKSIVVPAEVINGIDPLPGVFGLDGLSLDLPNGQLDWSEGISTTPMLGFYFRTFDDQEVTGFVALTIGANWSLGYARTGCPDSVTPPQIVRH